MKKHIWCEKAAIIGAKISRSIPTTPCSVLVWILWVRGRGRLKDWSVPHYCRHLQSRHSGTPSPRTWSPSSSTSPTSWSSYLVGACAGETITVLQTLRVGEPTTAPYCSCLVSNWERRRSLEGQINFYIIVHKKSYLPFSFFMCEPLTKHIFSWKFNKRLGVSVFHCREHILQIKLHDDLLRYMYVW